MKTIAWVTAIAAVGSIGIQAYVNYPDTELIEYHTTVEQGETVWDACREIASNEDELQKVVWQAMKDSNIKDASNVAPGTEIIVKVKNIAK